MTDIYIDAAVEAATKLLFEKTAGSSPSPRWEEFPGRQTLLDQMRPVVEAAITAHAAAIKAEAERRRAHVSDRLRTSIQRIPGLDINSWSRDQDEQHRRERRAAVEQAGRDDDRVVLESLGSLEAFNWHDGRKRADPTHRHPYRPEARLAFKPETAFATTPVLPLHAPQISPLVFSGTVTFAKGTDDYEAMPRNGTVAFEVAQHGRTYHYAGIRPVFDDEAGTVTLNLTPENCTSMASETPARKGTP